MTTKKKSCQREEKNPPRDLLSKGKKNQKVEIGIPRTLLAIADQPLQKWWIPLHKGTKIPRTSTQERHHKRADG